MTQVNSDVGCQFTEIFIKRPENVSLLLTFLEVINIENSSIEKEYY